MERSTNVNELINSDNVRNTIKRQNFFLAPVYVRRANMEDTNYVGYTLNRKNYNRESCTQTSKTIIELAKMDTGYMSPDSLNSSPRVPFSRVQAEKECEQIFGGYNHNHNDELIQIHMVPNQQVQPTHYYLSRADNYPCKYVIQNKNLKEIYQNNHKIIDNGYYIIPQNHMPEKIDKVDLNKSTIYKKDTETIKPHFESWGKVQNTAVAIKPPHEGKTPKLKSQSFVETSSPKKHFSVEPVHPQSHSKLLQPEKLPKHKRTMQFYRPTDSYNKGDGARKECKLLSHFQSKRSNSFMSPTLASEQKSLKQSVDTVRNLVGITCRGRISSPRIQGSDQIPYIDQSQCDLQVVKSEEIQKNKAECPKLNLNHSVSSVFDSSGSSENGLSMILNHVKSSDWNCSLKGLAEIAELARIGEPELLLPYMTIVNQRMLDLLRSPRSHVCRTACQLTGHLFESIKDTRRPEFDDIVNVLLYKTADANKFIRQDANLALDCMVTHIPTFHAVRSICAKGPTHRNPLVRCATVRLLICAVVITGPDLLMVNPNLEQSRKRVIANLYIFLEDKSAEARKYAERLYKILAKQTNFDYYLRKYLDKTNLDAFYRNVKFFKKG